ncbi:MAG: methyltransferase domain-containing protein [Vampirovibrionia bacterium]
MPKDLLLDKLFRYLRIKAVKRYIPFNSVICDIGCGYSGLFLKSIASYISKGIGIDKRVEESKDDKLIFINNDLDNALSLDSLSVDCVTLLAVIEHVNKPLELLEEIYRILKPGGKIVLTTPSPASKYVLEFLSFKLKLIDEELIKEHKYYFNKKELQDSLKKIGFKSIEIKYFEFKYNILAVAEK